MGDAAPPRGCAAPPPFASGSVTSGGLPLILDLRMVLAQVDMVVDLGHPRDGDEGVLAVRAVALGELDPIALDAVHRPHEIATGRIDFHVLADVGRRADRALTLR